jgi:DNA-directed RNA polymerase subunit RPC12/RpoP
MDPLDGNSIAGDLFEYFGAEMTTAVGTCAYCGASGQVGELRVYLRSPGAVVRCPSCGNVVIVLVRTRDVLRVDASAFRGLGP